VSFSINGKTAIVTGAANGLGLAIARQFVDKGAKVMCADMDEKRLTEEWGTLTEEGRVHVFAGDLRQRLTIANLVSATIDAFDQIDVLVNASRQIVPTNALDMEDETVRVMLEQNLFTALQLSQHVARRMIKHGEEQDEGQVGSIINLSSIAAHRSRPELMGFSVASAALEQMTRSMALALAPHRIRVNAVAFGSFMSASLQASLADQDEARDEIVSHTPLGRIAAPTELADAVQFLAAESAGFMTGQVITLDGGRSVLDAVSAPLH
jgi:7-alpha-hydroxysteroid dehydrogenase